MKLDTNKLIKYIRDNNAYIYPRVSIGILTYVSMIEGEAHKRVIQEYEKTPEYREKMNKEIEALLKEDTKV